MGLLLVPPVEIVGEMNDPWKVPNVPLQMYGGNNRVAFVGRRMHSRQWTQESTKVTFL